MRAVRRPGEFGIGDRGEFAGRAHTVISVSGAMIGLADRDGQVIGIAMAELVSAGGFALLDTRPRAPVPEAALLVRLADGVVGRVELTALADVATRTVTAAVLRPATKAPDASVLLARTVTPEPMRPGWPQAMAMAELALPFRRLLGIDERLEHAAARPVIIPSTIVVDHGKVFVSASFMASCEFLGISVQPARKAAGTDNAVAESYIGHIRSARSPVGRVPAQSLKQPRPQRGRRRYSGCSLARCSAWCSAC